MKKFFTLFFCVILLICFIACNNENVPSSISNDTESKVPSTSDSSPSEPTQSATSTTDEPYPVVSYTVTFDTKGGTPIASQLINENGYATEPIAPTKDNHIFDGWYVSDLIWNFNENKVNSNITLEAKWTEVHPTLDFNEYNGEYAVTGVKNKDVTSIEIPSVYNGKPVTGISVKAFKDCKLLSSLTIPDSIKIIADYAFEGCSALKALIIPDSVTQMMPTALFLCTSLQSLTLGEGIEEMIQLGTLTSLETIIIDENNAKFKTVEKDLYSKDGAELILCLSAKNDTSFVVPENVTKIRGQAFDLCTNLESITISKNVTYIGYATLSVSSIKNIIVDENNTLYKSIDGNLYSKDGTTLLTYAPGKIATSFETPENVTRIESYAFYGCDKLESLVLSSFLEEVPADAIMLCDALKSVTFLNGIKKIATRTISYCKALEEIIIPSSVTHIDAQAFLQCSNAVIYCELENKGIFWADNWNYDNYQVVWNYSK